MHDPDFLIGVAAASAQTESREGRGRSNWDVFADSAGKILDRSTNARCTEFEKRFEEDLDILAGAGVQAFRFSVAWPRIQPEGPGPANEAGLDLYRRMIDAMRMRDIEPWVTLFHWDIPQWAGDFRDRAISNRMADYGAIVAAALGDVVDRWIVLNEPNTVAVNGYMVGSQAPGLTSAPAMMAAVHHQNLALGLMSQAARSELGPQALIGTTHNVLPTYGVTDSDADRAAADRLSDLWNCAFLDPLFGKGYPVGLQAAIDPLVQPADMKTIAQAPDFLGVNYYTSAPVRADASPLGFALAKPTRDLPQTALFPVDPQGLTNALEWTHRRYGPIPLYVTETGFALDGPDWEARVHDADRVRYLDQYLEAAAAARANGVDLRGLFCWSATDNWEWAEGFAKKFGLIAVDPGTQKREAKDSLRSLRASVARHFPVPGTL